jgi:tRNA G18 (ribose-2'-O)-methylase SpoU
MSRKIKAAELTHALGTIARSCTALGVKLVAQPMQA